MNAICPVEMDDLKVTFLKNSSLVHTFIDIKSEKNC